MDKKERAKVRHLIEVFEYHQNGFHKLSGRDVEVLNVKKSVDNYTADVILHDREDKSHERFDGMKYPVAVLEKQNAGKKI